MRILLGHSFGPSAAFGDQWIESWLARLRHAGIDVNAFSLAYSPERPVLFWNELDRLWKIGDRRLLSIYETLGNASTDYDVFICYNGSNIHPNFVKQLSTFNAYACFDDPESSEKLSKPVAMYFDVALVGNIAAISTYRSWGVKNAYWWPLGYRHDDYDPTITRQQILQELRPIGVSLLCERKTAWRRPRVDAFASAFPDGAYYGPGWPAGFLPEAERISLLRQTRIGINIHNSTGPINFRTFYLPANGVMQICDNKSHLGQIFNLGTEVIGFDSINEAIELTKYYLTHDDQRREIAAAGWARALREYNEVACFQKIMGYLSPKKKDAKPFTPDTLDQHKINTQTRRLVSICSSPIVTTASACKRASLALHRHAHKFLADIRLRLALKNKAIRSSTSPISTNGRKCE